MGGVGVEPSLLAPYTRTQERRRRYSEEEKSIMVVCEGKVDVRYTVDDCVGM